jgi:hypothetical protein
MVGIVDSGGDIEHEDFFGKTFFGQIQKEKSADNGQDDRKTDIDIKSL